MLMSVCAIEDGVLFLYQDLVYKKICDVFTPDHNRRLLATEAIALWFRMDGKWHNYLKRDSEQFNPYALVQPVEVSFQNL